MSASEAGSMSMQAVASETPPEGVSAPQSGHLMILPVRGTVLFPGMVMPMTVGREGSVAAAQKAMRDSLQIGIVMQRDAQVEDPKPTDLHAFGTIARVMRYVTTPDGAHHLVCQGLQRFQILEIVQLTPFLMARIQRIEEPMINSPEIEARFIHLKQLAGVALDLLPQASPELVASVQAIASSGVLADTTAAYLDIKPEEKQSILETIDLVARVDRVTRHLAERIEVLRITQEIGQQTRDSLDKRQREFVLREQLASIQKQLGDSDEKGSETTGIGDAITNAGMPPEIEAKARKELRRLERMPEASPEHGMIRAYLDRLTELPWVLPDAPAIDLGDARRILDADHYGLEKIKQRIIEFLAVRKLAPMGKAPILCFVGPPGVGKTSLGQSIARAMGRPFVRVSLGGVHDEAEIRGHRRTYIGALPGNIIQALQKAGARNCVMMLDEIDKLGASHQGDPSAALLEVLDPEQNNTFRDNYLAVPFDLSRVVFIATANQLDTIAGPLRDRMEVIALSGYAEEEKFEIAKRFLLSRQLEANGLTTEQAALDDDALRAIIRDYTREAGVRSLEREIGKTLRNAAVRIADGSAQGVIIGAADLVQILGQPRFENEVALRTTVPGVATGLAWTPVGGDILFIEATRMSGHGKLILTGQLGEVMRESAQAALSLIKSRAEALGIDGQSFEESDIHIHVPAGGTPKDGPSAGVAMFVALVSLLTGRTVRNDTAMTGEISLRGLVLPVGGIKEKVAAAARAGISRVLLPARNRRDFDDISEDVRKKLEFIWLEQADEAIAAALTNHRATAAVPNLEGLKSANGGDPETAVRRPPLAAQAAGKRDSIKN
jgi:ATP-dependent Lon protease